MKNSENFRKLQEGRARMTKEEITAGARKGALRTNEIKREKKKFKELASVVLSAPIRDGELEAFTTIEDSNGKNLTLAEKALLVQAVKALGGDLKALEFLRDSSGQKEAEKQTIEVENRTTGKIDQVLAEMRRHNEKNKKDEKGEKDEKKGHS